MSSRRSLIVLGTWGLVAPALAARFVEPADMPALPSALAARSPLLAAAHAGERAIAVGRRGTVVYTSDGGATWTQATVPVSVDLTAVCFPRPATGWAVGHGGVAIETRDGGATWTKRLAGKQADEIALRHYASRTSPTPQERHALARARTQSAERHAQPFLDVMFEDEATGFAVGAFNTIFRTGDGGRSWVPWMDRSANPEELHFYAVRGQGGRIFLAGEQGMVWRLADDRSRFVPVPTPFRGTLFGLVVTEGGTILAFGMRGAVLRSADEGSSWESVPLQTTAGITAGVAPEHGLIALVDQAGVLHLSQDDGRTFAAVSPERAVPCYGVAAGRPGTLVIAGAAGVRTVTLP